MLRSQFSEIMCRQTILHLVCVNKKIWCSMRLYFDKMVLILVCSQFPKWSVKTIWEIQKPLKIGTNCMHVSSVIKHSRIQMICWSTKMRIPNLIDPKHMDSSQKPKRLFKFFHSFLFCTKQTISHSSFIYFYRKNFFLFWYHFE